MLVVQRSIQTARNRGLTRRQLLRRAEVEATCDGATIRVKLAERPDGGRTAKAAHDDVATEPGLDQRRRLRAAAVRRALKSDDS